MSGDSNELLSKIFESFSLENAPETSGKNGMHLLTEEMDKTLFYLYKQRAELQEKISWLSDTSNSIQDLSGHARINCRPKMSKFVEVDALLTTSEYKLKYDDYSVLSSLKMTADYCQKSIDLMAEEVKTIDEHIERIKEQQLLALGVIGGSRTKEVVQVDENSTLTMYENGLVDIVETDSQPVVQVERKAKFRTRAERDEYLKNIRSKGKE